MASIGPVGSWKEVGDDRLEYEEWDCDTLLGVDTETVMRDDGV